VLAILRDGRHVLGRLISYDHFGTLVLAGARERHVVGAPAAAPAAPAAPPAPSLVVDIDIAGLYVVRGENLTLLAEIVRGVRGLLLLSAACDVRGGGGGGGGCRGGSPPWVCARRSLPPHAPPRRLAQDEAADASNPLLVRHDQAEVLALEVAAAAAAEAAAPPAPAGLARSLGANRVAGVAATVPALWAMGE
jgi:small nuclear ribonucleoprotein (snRNP)-like protein